MSLIFGLESPLAALFLIRGTIGMIRRLSPLGKTPPDRCYCKLNSAAHCAILHLSWAVAPAMRHSPASGSGVIWRGIPLRPGLANHTTTQPRPAGRVSPCPMSNSRLSSAGLSRVCSTFHYTLCWASNKIPDELGSGAIGRRRRLGFHSRRLVASGRLKSYVALEQVEKEHSQCLCAMLVHGWPY